MPFQKGNQLAKRADHSARRGMRYLSAMLSEEMRAPNKDDPSKSNAEVMTRTLIAKATNGEDPECLRAQSMILDRIEGKPTERKESTSVQHKINWDAISPEAKEQLLKLQQTASEILDSEQNQGERARDITGASIEGDTQ